MSQNLTAGDVRVIDDQFSLNMTKPGSKPPLKGKKNQARHLSHLQHEIDKYQKEIELMKLKLQFKQQLMSYKGHKTNKDFRGTTYQNPSQGGGM